MTDAPVIIKRTSKPSEKSDFSFSEKDISVLENADLMDMRRKAWQIYQATPFPTTAEEAWRRTDLSKLDDPPIIFLQTGMDLLLSTKT